MSTRKTVVDKLVRFENFWATILFDRIGKTTFFSTPWAKWPMNIGRNFCLCHRTVDMLLQKAGNNEYALSP